MKAQQAKAGPLGASEAEITLFVDHDKVEMRRSEEDGRQYINIRFHARPIHLDAKPIIEQLREAGMGRKDANRLAGEMMDEMYERLLMDALMELRQ